MNRAEIITMLEDLSIQMTTVAIEMDRMVGTTPAIQAHAIELAGAASVALSWAKGLEAEIGGFVRVEVLA